MERPLYIPAHRITDYGSAIQLKAYNTPIGNAFEHDGFWLTRCDSSHICGPFPTQECAEEYTMFQGTTY
jgi:hypothetical protein